MTERLDVVPERFLTPDYWGGHSLADDCHWTGITTTKQIERQIDQTRRTIETLAKPHIETFLDFHTHLSVQRFHQWEEFTSVDLPSGTPVRLSVELLATEEEKPIYHSFQELAIILSTKEKIPFDRVIAAFSPNSAAVYSFTPLEQVHIGKTDHSRHKILFPARPVMHELIKKITMIEILKGAGGKEVRESIPHRFNPGFQPA